MNEGSYLKLMYITNDATIAKIAEQSGVDSIWIDLETIGKEDRQRGLNTVKSNHVISDVSKIRDVITESELLVRVNPLYDGSKEEIDEVIGRGADNVMLPMFETVDEAKIFIDYVNGRAKVLLLVETLQAEKNIEAICRNGGVDEIHIGLNDLHLAKHKDFMFELLIDGTVEHLVSVIKESGIRYGFGGIAKLDEGMVPARHVIAEHYRLGSTMAILSRSFYDSWISRDYEEIEGVFRFGIGEIRDYEERLMNKSEDFFIDNQQIIKQEIEAVVRAKTDKSENDYG